MTGRTREISRTALTLVLVASLVLSPPATAAGTVADAAAETCAPTAEATAPVTTPEDADEACEAGAEPATDEEPAEGAEEPADDLEQEPAADPAAPPAEEPAEKPAGDPAESPAAEPVDDPAGTPADEEPAPTDDDDSAGTPAPAGDEPEPPAPTPAQPAAEPASAAAHAGRPGDDARRGDDGGDHAASAHRDRDRTAHENHAEGHRTTGFPAVTAAPGPRPVQRAPHMPLRATPGGYVFPVAGPGVSYGDSFGAGRALTGWHHGEDIFAPEGAPLLAVADGELFSVGWNPIGGWRLWLRDAEGNEFYYAHLSAFAPAAAEGARVRAGEVIGFVGHTGDAQGTPSHLHFEIHPAALVPLGYDASAVAPYPYLTGWERLADVPPELAMPAQPAAAIGSAPEGRLARTAGDAPDLRSRRGPAPAAVASTPVLAETRTVAVPDAPDGSTAWWALALVGGVWTLAVGATVRRRGDATVGLTARAL